MKFERFRCRNRMKKDKAINQSEMLFFFLFKKKMLDVFSVLLTQVILDMSCVTFGSTEKGPTASARLASFLTPLSVFYVCYKRALWLMTM